MSTLLRWIVHMRRRQEIPIYWLPKDVWIRRRWNRSVHAGKHQFMIFLVRFLFWSAGFYPRYFGELCICAEDWKSQLIGFRSACACAGYPVDISTLGNAGSCSSLVSFCNWQGDSCPLLFGGSCICAEDRKSHFIGFQSRCACAVDGDWCFHATKHQFMVFLVRSLFDPHIYVFAAASVNCSYAQKTNLLAFEVRVRAQAIP